MPEFTDEERLMKRKILSKNNTFRTAFMATLGFYAGQTVATLLGALTILGVFAVLYKIFN